MFFVHTIAIGLLGIGIGMLYFGKVEGFLWILAAPSSYLLAGIAYLLSRQKGLAPFEHACGGPSCTHLGCAHRIASDQSDPHDPITHSQY